MHTLILADNTVFSFTTER